MVSDSDGRSGALRTGRRWLAYDVKRGVTYRRRKDKRVRREGRRETLQDRGAGTRIGWVSAMLLPWLGVACLPVLSGNFNCH